MCKALFQMLKIYICERRGKSCCPHKGFASWKRAQIINYKYSKINK